MDGFTRVPEALRAPRIQQIRRLIQAVDRAWTRGASNPGRPMCEASGDSLFRLVDGTERR